MLSALLMSRICKRFASGQKPYSALGLRKETAVPIRFVNDLLYDMTEAGLLIEVTSDEKGETSHFIPAEDLKNMTVGTLIDRLESRGRWKIDLDLSELFHGEWSKAVELRSIYLKDSRKILLQDL